MDGGFDEHKISVVENAIDTKMLRATYEGINDDELQRIKEYNSIGNGPIGLYCGGMYKEKRLDFLLEACIKIREEISDFEMIFIGAGPEDFKINNIAQNNKWIHYLGPKFNNEKVPFFKISDLFLMPGLVGLAVLDAFTMQTPLITTKYQFHSPEIEYLENGFNGIITENNLDIYIQEVIQLFNDNEKLDNLKKGCLESSQYYTVEKMINNFSGGIVKCINEK